MSFAARTTASSSGGGRVTVGTVHHHFGDKAGLYRACVDAMYDEFEGDRFSHACPFARVMEEQLVSHLVQVGIRTLTGHQQEQARRFGVEMIDMRAWADGARPSVGGPVYVSLDLDVLDPAVISGVGLPVPFGLSLDAL